MSRKSTAVKKGPGRPKIPFVEWLLRQADALGVFEEGQEFKITRYFTRNGVAPTGSYRQQARSVGIKLRVDGKSVHGIIDDVYEVERALESLAANDDTETTTTTNEEE